MEWATNNNVIDLTADGDTDSNASNNVFHMEVKGQPRPMERPRKGRRTWYSPSARQVKAFKAAAAAARSQNQVMFPAGVPVTVEIDFYMRRANGHFKKGRRFWHNLTDAARRIKVQPWGADVDNLAKLVLDGMNGVVCQDDIQVVKLCVVKKMDVFDDCGGRTVVHVTECEDDRNFL